MPNMNIQMQIPTAKEAEQKVLRGDYKKAQEQADVISKLIIAAINEGKRSITLDEFYIELAVKSQLENMGYIVQSNSYRNEQCLTISF
jgi:hypothetical protein